MTKDEFIATLHLMGFETNILVMNPRSSVEHCQILRTDGVRYVSGWITFRPQGRNHLDVDFFKGDPVRVTATGKRKVLMQKLVAALEDFGTQSLQ